MMRAAAMSEAGGSERLIGQLADHLQPVRRLWPPWQRALLWLGVVAAVALVLAAAVPLLPIAHRLMGAADMMLAVVGSTLTAIFAAFAAFALSVPGRSRRWALLPLPAVALWLGASGLGCLRSVLVPDAHAASFAETMDCLRFILGFSVPLSLLLLWMLRRAAPLQPGLVAALAGLAAAAAAASLLWFVHPFDATASDLAVHVVAVGAVIGLNRLGGGRLLRAAGA
jgi:hypothetical protein